MKIFIQQHIIAIDFFYAKRKYMGAAVIYCRANTEVCPCIKKYN
jgi:hypothetical protein